MKAETSRYLVLIVVAQMQQFVHLVTHSNGWLLLLLSTIVASLYLVHTQITIMHTCDKFLLLAVGLA